MPAIKTAPDADIAGVSVHALSAQDKAAVEEVFAGLSPDSRFARYHTGTPMLPSGMKALLRRIDGDGVAAHVARSPTGAAIGLVWVIRTGDAEAELAIEVVDAWHGCGVGSRLISAAQLAATGNGIERLRAEVLGTNRAAVGLLRKTAPHATVVAEGPELVFYWEPGAWATSGRAA